jgi:hypothetical protein
MHICQNSLRCMHGFLATCCPRSAPCHLTLGTPSQSITNHVSDNAHVGFMLPTRSQLVQVFRRLLRCTSVSAHAFIHSESIYTTCYTHTQSTSVGCGLPFGTGTLTSQISSMSVTAHAPAPASDTCVKQHFLRVNSYAPIDLCGFTHTNSYHE